MELLSQEYAGLENGTYKMEVKSSGASFTSELVIKNDQFMMRTKEGEETMGKIIWSDSSFFTLMKDGTKRLAEPNEDDGIIKLSEPSIERNSSYSLQNRNGRTIEFTIHPQGNLHIVRGTGKLIRLKE